MATNTYVALDTKTVTSAVSSVTFTSIPQGYTDLVIVADISYASLSGGNVGYVFCQVGNGSIDTGSNYSVTDLRGTGSAAASYRSSNSTQFDLYSNITTTTHGIFRMNFQNYSNTTTYKTLLCREDDTTNVNAVVGTWRSTSAINTIKIFDAQSYNFAVGSTFTIYGVAAVPQLTAKATGGTIYYGADGYVYHKFTSNGTFTPSQSLTADILVVAGGGGGGSGNNSGGGGAGGLLAFTSQSLSATGYTCTVGGGGATGNPNGSNGTDSQFGLLTLVKGGGYGAGYTYTGGNGGSGGGNPFDNTGTAGQPTSGQGYAGGAGQGVIAPDYFGGGGGGAGEAGNTDAIGYGGDGSASYTSWGLITSSGQNVSGTYYYAGGGGGAGQLNAVMRQGGDGGGGHGSGDGVAASAGTANTGGGGGGSGNSAGNAGAAGGSGIIIVRYLG